MNIKRAKEEIRNTVKAYLANDESGRPLISRVHQRPILLIGAPGIGKTAIMEQTAHECGIALVAYTMTHHTRQSALGLPQICHEQFDGQDITVTEYTMSEIIASIYKKEKETGLRQGILFIDEINCVSETLTPVMLQFLQEKTFGSHRIPDGWIICAAGNPPEYNRSVREFDVVTLDRVKKIEVEPDYPVWREYARTAGVHGSILAYLDARQENFYKVESTPEGRRFVTARGWEDLSELMKAYEKTGLEVDDEVIGEYLQDPVIAEDFANFLTLYRKYEERYNVSDILRGKQSPQVDARVDEAPFDERISIVSMLLSGLHRSFTEAWIADRKTDTLFRVLKKVQKADDTGAFAKIVREEADSFRKSNLAAGLSREEETAGDQALTLLDDWNGQLAGQTFDSPAEQFEFLRKNFLQVTQEREEATEEAGKRLACAFDFLEKHFSPAGVPGPEMILFVTELAAGYYSLWFLETEGSDTFDRYNAMLKIDSGREKLQERIRSAREN
ncbi:MAG: ATP-binding protein [Lachnospiraceae bacterium]|jgi:MoxR-like ATPase